MTVIGMTPKPAPSPVDEPTQLTIIEYPESDGEPMGETGIHVRATLAIYSALRDYYWQQGRHDIYVAADMFLYYEEGNPRAQKAPDVMVIMGVDGGYERRSFKTWEEGASPTVIFEVTSKSTWQEDLINKRALYKRLGVKEYFIFDPLNEYLQDSFQGMYFDGVDYAPLAMDEDGAIWSKTLGVKLRRLEEMLRVVDPETDRIVPVFEETKEMIAAAERRAEEQTRRAEEQTRRAEEQTRRAAHEAQRADAAEDELERLRAMVEQLQKKQIE